MRYRQRKVIIITASTILFQVVKLNSWDDTKGIQVRCLHSVLEVVLPSAVSTLHSFKTLRPYANIRVGSCPFYLEGSVNVCVCACVC